MCGEAIDVPLTRRGRLTCLEAMLQKLLGEHATVVRHEHERARHLADAISDLQTMIARTSEEHPR